MQFSIQKKILLILVAANIAFIIYLAANTWSVTANRAKLNQVSNQQFPMLLLAQSAHAQLNTINDQLQLAVTTGDNEQIQLADQTKIEFDNTINSIEMLNSERLINFNNMATKVDIFFKQARSIAQGMVEGTADLSNLASSVRKKNTAYENAQKALNDFYETQDKQLKETIKEANDTARFSLVLGVIIAIITFIILSIIAIPIALSISHKLEAVTSSLRDISQGSGDLKKRIEKTSNDEIGNLIDAFNNLIAKLQKTISEVVSTADPLSDIAFELNAIANSASDQMGSQRRASEDASHAVNDMHVNIKFVAENTETAANEATLADDKVNTGQNVVNDTKLTISKLAVDIEAASSIVSQLESDSGSVGMILDVIRGIAEQTNLLALNAAIEAARAGEQGRGFAVVADEVRSLASKTQQSTEEINSLITQLQHNASKATSSMAISTEQARESVRSVDNVSEQFQFIANAMSNIKAISKQVSQSIEDEKDLAEKIVKHVKIVDQIAVRAEERTNALTNSSKSLTAKADQLKHITHLFNV